MDTNELKHKLRELKKAEKSIRFTLAGDYTSKHLVWDDFFTTRDNEVKNVRYAFRKLEVMDKQSLKEVFAEYFYFVYFQKYRENGISFDDAYDPSLLEILGLRPGVGFEEIKRRFRELAKKYHPDLGGDSEKMISLLETYHKLTGG